MLNRYRQRGTEKHRGKLVLASLKEYESAVKEFKNDFLTIHHLGFLIQEYNRLRQYNFKKYKREHEFYAQDNHLSLEITDDAALVNYLKSLNKEDQSFTKQVIEMLTLEIFLMEWYENIYEAFKSLDKKLRSYCVTRDLQDNYNFEIFPIYSKLQKHLYKQIKKNNYVQTKYFRHMGI